MNTNSNSEQFDRYSRELMRMYRQQQEGSQNMNSNVSDKSIPPEQNTNASKAMNMDFNSQQQLNAPVSAQEADQQTPMQEPSMQQSPMQQDAMPQNPMQQDAMQQTLIQETPPWLSDISPNIIEDLPSEAKEPAASRNTSPSENDMSVNCLKDDDSSVWENFNMNNPDNGFIKAQVFAGRFTIPVGGAEVIISKTIDGETRVFHCVLTDESGMTAALPVPAPAQSASLTPQGARPYQTYTLTVKKDGYRTVIKENLPVFPGIVSMQPIQFQPDSGSNGPSAPDIQVEPGTSL